MAKLMVFLMIMAGIMLLLNVGGLQTTESFLLKSTGVTGDQTNPSTDPQSSSFYLALLIGIAVFTGAAAIFAGLIGSNNFISILGAATMATILGTFISDLVLLQVQAGKTCISGAICAEWVYWIVWVISIPIIIGYMISIFDWIRGND